VSGRVLAKPVIVDLDGEMAMAVVPANRRLIVEDLREVTGCERVKLVGENAFKSKFPDCETGAMPPFGNLYGMDTYLAAELGQNHDIAFNGGSHREVIVMAYKDYERIAKPKVLETIA
jgi:Ala-tRNA(Pro) deacylase